MKPFLPLGKFNIHGKLKRPLLKVEILDAQSKTPSASQAARFLGVSYNTYKHWAKYYGIFVKNQWGRGATKKQPSGKKFASLDEVLAGKYPYYNLDKLRDRLIVNNRKVGCCDLCGYNRRREDGRVPLKLLQKDGNPNNYALENLEFRCFNCLYLTREIVGQKRMEYLLSKDERPLTMENLAVPAVDPDDLENFKKEIAEGLK